jgi:hypothetical protein
MEPSVVDPPARRFLVLARRAYTESLACQGTMGVGAGDDPAAVARQRFGGDWLELVLAPVPAVYWVIEPQAGVPA